MKKKILGLVLAMGLAVPAFASIGISPTRIEVNANKLKSNFFSTALDVRGDAEKPMRFRVYPGYFTIDENGEMNVIEKSNDPHDISKKIRFVPAEFTVASGKTQKLRINVPNIKQLADGENRAALFIEDVNPKEMNIPTGQSGIGAQLIVKTRVGIPVYIDKNVTKSVNVEYMNIERQKDGISIKTKLVSTGNARVRYSAKAQIIQGKKLISEHSLRGGIVGGDTYYIDKQFISTKQIQESGQYTLRMIISYIDGSDKKKVIKQEKTINIQGNV